MTVSFYSAVGERIAGDESGRVCSDSSTLAVRFIRFGGQMTAGRPRRVNDYHPTPKSLRRRLCAGLRSRRRAGGFAYAAHIQVDTVARSRVRGRLSSIQSLQRRLSARCTAVHDASGPPPSQSSTQHTSPLTRQDPAPVLHSPESDILRLSPPLACQPTPHGPCIGVISDVGI